MKRKIITIDEEKCTGCGLCIPDCPEGALQVIDGKARLVSDLFCDGLGACVGACPTGAMKVVEREAEPYDESRVMANIIKQGEAVITAHLVHLKEHGEEQLYQEALEYLVKNNISIPSIDDKKHGVTGCSGGCPGSQNITIERKENERLTHEFTEQPSQLRQWPVQLHLLNPAASFFQNADLLIAADCVPFAYNGFHNDLLNDKVVIMFCPKLDSGLEQYVERLAQIFKTRDIRTVAVARMEVPCCHGTRVIIDRAMQRAGKDIPVQELIISIKGTISKSASVHA